MVTWNLLRENCYFLAERDKNLKLFVRSHNLQFLRYLSCHPPHTAKDVPLQNDVASNNRRRYVASYFTKWRFMFPALIMAILQHVYKVSPLCLIQTRYRTVNPLNGPLSTHHNVLNGNLFTSRDLMDVIRCNVQILIMLAFFHIIYV